MIKNLGENEHIFALFPIASQSTQNAGLAPYKNDENRFSDESFASHMSIVSSKK